MESTRKPRKLQKSVKASHLSFHFFVTVKYDLRYMMCLIPNMAVRLKLFHFVQKHSSNTVTSILINNHYSKSKSETSIYKTEFLYYWNNISK